MKPKTGVVDVGGGFRGAYAAGVPDCCMHRGIHTLCRDPYKMKLLYGKGYVDAEKITPFLFG